MRTLLRRFIVASPTNAGVALYAFFLEGVAAEPTLNQPDGLHPNAQGVDEIVRRILPKVEELLRRVDS